MIKSQENQDETLRIFFDFKNRNKADTILLSENSSNCGDVNELNDQEDHDIELPLSIKTYKDRSKNSALSSMKKSTERGKSESRNEESVVIFNCEDLISSSGTCKESLSRSSSCKGSLSIVDEQDSMLEISPKMMYNQIAKGIGETTCLPIIQEPLEKLNMIKIE